MQAQSYIFFDPGYDGSMLAGRPTNRARTTFGERLALARQQAGLTQAQLAVKLKTSQRVITYWEREKVALRADQLTALAEALGVSADFLLSREETKPRNGGPTGKMRQLFESASRLPRIQQQKVLDILQPFVREHVNQEAQA